MYKLKITLAVMLSSLLHHFCDKLLFKGLCVTLCSGGGYLTQDLASVCFLSLAPN